MNNGALAYEAPPARYDRRSGPRKLIVRMSNFIQTRASDRINLVNAGRFPDAPRTLRPSPADMPFGRCLVYVCVQRMLA
jgi:hypothetical protein